MGLTINGSEVKGAQMDMISRLPDEIICHILSLMPTKFSIRTSLLSRRWEDLWILAPKVDFELKKSDYEGHSDDKGFKEQFRKLCVDNFTRSIDNFLFRRDNLYIESFRLSHKWDHAKIDRLRPNLWLCCVLACNVHELDLAIGGTYLEELPPMLFTCKTLVVLKISSEIVIGVPFYVCLPNLKTLVLEYVLYLRDVSITKLLSGCPILEDFQLLIYACQWYNILMYDVSHRTLKRLKLELHEEFDCKIKVDAPKLEFIELRGLSSGEFLVSYLPSIVKAAVDTCRISYDWEDEIEQGKKVIAFLKSISNVEWLFLSNFYFNYSGHGIGPKLPKFCNLVKLEITLSNENPSKLYLLMDLLVNYSPKLEVLSLPWGVHDLDHSMLYYDGDDDDDDVEVNIDLENDWRDLQHVPECLLHSLKSIQVRNFRADDNELNIVKYLLKNAIVLENMTISCSNDLLYNFIFVVLKKELENHPRGSTNCQLDILEA